MVIKADRITGPLNKALGLIGTKKSRPIYFETRWGIHTLFMNFSIDVLVLDSGFKVVKIKEYLGPYRIWFWPPIFNKILELPAGEVRKRNIKIGDKITV